MVPQHHHRRHRILAATALLTAVAALSLGAACDKVPLLAPSGSVITIFPTATIIPANGSTDIVATVIENGSTQTPAPPANGGNGTTTTPGSTSTPGAGTPVQNGTLVSFTTTLGRIEPSEARTENGQVRVKLVGNGQSGSATVTAFSGGASGRFENLLIGSAAAERVVVSATPQTLGPAGGSAQIAARVEDMAGSGLVGIPVTFSTNTGQLSAISALTNEDGIAQTTLTTTREAIPWARRPSAVPSASGKPWPREPLEISTPGTRTRSGW